MLIGYIRAMRGDEDGLLAQRQALQDAGCEQLVEDPAARDQWEQPGLREVLDRLGESDVVVVCRLECLGRSLQDVVRVMQRIEAAGAGLRSVAEAVDTTTPQGRTTAQLVGTLAELDRTAVRERINTGLAAARAEGRVGGRRSKLTPQQQARIADEVLSGRSSAAAMARLHKVSEPTISRLMATHRAGAGAPGGGHHEGAHPGHEDRIAGALPHSALDERLAIVGTSGSGKTYAAKGLVERLMGQGARVCVVDPLGVWWGLRLGPDGAAPSGYPVVVFGGRHADVALDESMGAALGRLVGTRPLACVVDVSDLGSSAARRGFMTAFMEALYQANTEPLHLVLDEADLWAPQRVQPAGGHCWAGSRRSCVAGTRARLRAVADHPASGRAAQGRTEPGRHLGVHEAHLQSGPQCRGPLDRGPGRPRRGRAHPGRAAPPLLRRGLGVGAVRRRAGARGVPTYPHLRQLAHAATGRARRGTAHPGRGGPVRHHDSTRRHGGERSRRARRPCPRRPTTISDLARRPRQQDRELAVAQVRAAEVGTEAAVMRVWFEDIKEHGMRAGPAASAIR